MWPNCRSKVTYSSVAPSLVPFGRVFTERGKGIRVSYDMENILPTGRRSIDKQAVECHAPTLYSRRPRHRFHCRRHDTRPVIRAIHFYIKRPHD